MYSTFTSSIYFKILLSLGILSLGTSTEPDQIDRNERVTATTAGVEQKFTSPGALSAAMTFIVTTTADSGPGSLREAIDLANANAGADDITFSTTGTLTLVTSLPNITEAVTITGSPGFVIASNLSVFQITGGASNVVIQNLDMSACSNFAVKITGGSSNVTIDGNNMANTSGTAINIDGNSSSVTINDNDFTGRSRAINTILVDGLTITNNNCSNTGIGGSFNFTTFQLNLTENLLIHSNNYMGAGRMITLQNFTELNISDTQGAGANNIVLTAGDNYATAGHPLLMYSTSSSPINVNISNLTFSAGSGSAILISHGENVFVNNVSVDDRATGIFFSGSLFDGSVECSSFTNMTSNAIRVDGTLSNLNIENNSFSCITGEVIDNSTATTIKAENNFYGYDADPVAGDFGGPVDFDPFLSAAAVCAPDGSASCAALVPSPAAALDFDGVNDHVNCGDLNALDGISKATIEVWANFDELSGNKIIVGKGTDVNNRIAIQQFGSTLFFVVGDGQNEFGGVNNAVSANTWHHIVLVFDGTLTDNSKRIRAYIDGVEQTFDGSTTTNFPATTNINAGNLIIGNAAGYNYFSGQLDEVRIWSSARTCEEINFYKDCELAGTEADLEAYYQFNQGDASGTNTGETILDDLTSNNNNGTLTGFATLTGSSSNWVAPGSVTTGNSCVGSPVFPEITVNNTLIGTQFGAVEVGAIADLIYTITNDGNGDLDISNISVDNGLFTVPTTVTSIAAGSTLDFTVTFAPTSTGTATGTVSIQSNDCDEDPYTFIIMAQGVCNANISNVTATDEVCPGAEDGTITVNATCTTCTSIEYSIDGTNFGSANVFTNVAPGTYTVTIQDSGDVTCSATQSVTVATGADTENPSISCPADITTNTEPGICQASVDLIHATGNDNCGDVTITSDATVDGVRYIRLTQNLAGLPLNLAELEAFQSGVNIAANATVTQSTNPGYPLTNFTDGDLTNFMHTINGIGQWVEVDLGSEQNLEYIRVHNRFDCCQNRGESLTLEYKDASNNVIESNNDFDVYEGVNAPHFVDDGTNVYQLGTTNITWTATDAAGNSTSCVQTITVIDNQNPTIECPVAVSQTVDTGVCESAVTIGTPVTGDNCGVASITNDYNNTSDASDTYPAGTTMVIWTVVDDNGLINSCVQNVVITDDEAPIAHCAVNFTVNLDANQVASVDAAAINNGSVDNCGSANVSITSGQIAYDCDDVGQTFEVTLTVADGNATSANSTCSTMVTVGDADSNCCDAAITSIIPDANCPSTITVNATCTTCAGLEYSINGTDFQNDSEFTEVAAGNYTVTARDTNDPSCSASTSVTVAADTEAPSVTCGADISANTAAGTCEATVNWTTAGQLTFSDNCGINGGTVDLGLGAGPVAVTDPNASIGGTYPVGSTQVTYTISDAAGLIASCSFNVVVTDDEDPVANCVSKLDLTLDASGMASITVADINNNSTDNCGIASLTISNDEFDCSDLGGSTFALDFDDADDYVSFGNPSEYDFTTNNAFTVEAWLNPSTTGGGWHGFLGKGHWSANSGFLLYMASGSVYFVRMGSNYNTLVNHPIAANTWTHIAGVYDQGAMTLFVNGVAVSSWAGNGVTYANSSTPLVIGARNNNGGTGVQDYFPGLMDEVKIWNVARTGLEIAGFMNTALSGQEAGLVGYYPIENGPGSATVDDLAMGNTANLQNMDPSTDWVSGAPNVIGGSVEVVLSITDNSGKISNCTTSINLSDDQTPTVPCASIMDQTVDLDGNCQLIIPDLIAGLTASDNCSAELSQFPEAGNLLNSSQDQIHTITITATDIVGNTNTTSCTIKLTGRDGIAPSAICATDFTVNLDAGQIASVDAAAINNGSADNCGSANVSITSGQIAYDCDDVGQTFEVTLTVDDGNATSANSTCSTMVTVGDADGNCCDAAIISVTPDANCPSTITVNATCTTCAGLEYSINGTDFQNDSEFTEVAAGNYTVTARDTNDPSCSASTSVTVAADTEAPSVTCGADISANTAAGTCEATFNWTTAGQLTFSDNCGINGGTVDLGLGAGPVAVTDPNASIGGTYPVGSTQVTYTISDAAGLIASCSFNVVVTDDEDPTFEDASQVLLYENDFENPAVPITAGDCGGGIDAFPGINTWYGTPAYTFAQIFTVEVTDINWPGYSDPSGIGGNYSIGMLSSAQNDLLSLTFDAENKTFLNVRMDLSPIGLNGCFTSNPTTPIMRLSVYDSPGGVFDINNPGVLLDSEDLIGENPDLSDPRHIYVWSEIAAGLDLSSSIDGNISLVWDLIDGGYAAFDNLVIDASNVSVGSGCPEDFTISCLSELPTAPILTGFDNCTLDPTVTFTESAINTAINNQSITRTWTVTDDSNNSLSCVQIITVDDNESPIITCPVAVTVSADVGLCTASSVSLGTATVTDNCTAITPTNDALPTFSVGITPVTWTANDNNGQVVTCVQNVIVADNEAPIALCQDITVNLDVNSSYTLTAGEIDANSTDNCGISAISIPATTFDCDDLSGPVPVILTIVDNNNNSHTCTAQVTVADPLATCCAAPQASCQTATLSFQGNSSLTILPVDINAGSTADCGLVSMTVSPNTFNCADYVGSNLTVTNVNVTLTVEDINGATSACNTTVSIINDDNPPVFDCPANISVNNEPGLCTANITYDVTATDNCSTVSINQTEGLASGNDFPVGVTTNTFTANDVDNNSSTCSFTVTVIDTEAPTAVCQDITVVLEESGPSSVSDITISGTINQYAEVTAVGSNNVAVASAAGFGTGDKVLMIQMKGATIDLTNAATFGDVTAANEAGNYEYARIQSIVGSNITFISDLSKNYDPTKPVQLVRVPEYDNVIISGTLTAADWNGAIGGVLAFDAQGTVTLNANIDMKGKGFRGGNRSSNYYNGCENFTDYFIASPSIRAGDKGEGIADEGSAFGAGRGKAANGGGGGGSVNSGGGGGANYGAGGQGGREYVGCNQPLGGLGAATLSSLNLNDKIFLGGGGGGGQQNNSVSTNGADGGGIVLITANAIEGNGNQIIASGNDAINASNDGAGGGGAGGVVLLNVAAVNSALSINLTGGKGGNSAGGHGPAGGGGGGLFWHSGATLPANVTPLLNGGLNGTAAGDPFGTSPGQSGGTLTHLAFPGVTTISATTIVLTDVDAGSTDNCTIAGITLSQTEFGCEHLGPNPVSLTVIDVNGLSDACNAVITVVENTPPVLTCPADMTVDTEAGICEATVNFTALVSDNCDDAPNLTYSQNPGTVFSLGTTTIIVNATDVSTNNSSCSFDVTVVDNEKPTITCAANVAVNNDAGECGAVVTPMTPTFSDNCEGGMGGSALNLDGINDNVSVANGFPAMTELTYETWLYPEAISNWDVIMNFDGWAPGYVHFQFFPNGVLEFSINGNSPTDQFTTQSFTPNEWYHLAAVYSSTDKYVKFYINGQLVNTRSYTTALPLAGNRPFRIGSWNGNSRHFDGSFDDIRVWNYARTQSEIQASMTSTLNGLEAGLIAYYNFDDGTGCDDNTGVDMLTDFAGGDNGGQLNGFALDGSQTCQSNWTGGAPISTVSISNDFTGTADASGTYPIGTTTVTWTATDAAGLTSTCTQEVTVTDAEAPTAACTDITIDLIDRNTYSLTQANIDMMAAGTSDNCTGVTYAITAGTTDYDCDDRDAQFELTLTATDAAGLTNSCTATVTIADPNSVCNDPPIAVCQDITIFTGANCDASIVAADVDGGSSDPDLDPLDLVIDHDGPFGVGTHTVILTVSDTEFSDNCTATITVQDNTLPTALCQDITVQLDAAGVATITTADINNGSTDACGIASLALDDTDFECKDIDAGTVVTLTVTDIHNNSSTCTANVTVEDNIDPVAVCQDITIQLDATGSASITPAQIDNGSSDACGLANNSLDVSTFSCLNVGTNNVILSVTDIHTNESSCTAIVTVEDKVAPVAVCQDLTIQLDASGSASISEDAVNDGSSDACNGLIFDTDITDFTCTNVGDNPVILTITDANNNSSTCTATITIEDKVAPIAICQDLTIQLDASGNASISEDAVNDGSNDACNGLTFDTDITAFACANVGDNPVILTITDANNNSSTCTATITIEDRVAPIAICQDLTVTLDATGSATITANDIDNGSNDACGIQDLVLDDYSFDCTDVGADQAANNYSLDFDGIDDWIDATGNGGAKASATSLGLPTQAITLEVYAYVNTFGIWKSFVSFIQDNGSFERGWDLETRTNGKFGFTLNSIGGGGALTYMETTNSFNLGQWYHIAGTYDGTTMKIYVDGVLENTSIAENGDIWYADSWLAMGVYKDDNEMNHLISGMDEVRIFDYAKTQAEIQATMSSTLSGIEPGLVAYYAFEDGPGSSTVTDLSGNGHDGVLLNMDPATDWVAGSTATAGTGGGALVNLTVTDVNGLSSSCAANVTVIDNTAPIAQCQDVSVLLDANGDANITVNDIDNGSSDACGIESLVLDETSFDCADVGENEVMFIATDVNNNADTCYAIVTVEDKIAPIALCQDITVQLDAGTNNGDGSVAIVPEDIDNGSNDACGILDLSLNISDFDCSNIGMNPVTLTVTDNNNNVTSCTAEVTVEDKVAPVISSCPIDQVLVNTPGDCSTLASWPIPAISDNCDSAPTGVFTAPGVNIVLNALGQFPVGSTTVTYTVKDDHNNETSCDFTITVTDIEPPTITSCPSSDIIVDNDAGLCEAAVDYGILVASDNCAGVIFTADTNHEIDGDIFAVGTTEVSFTATDAVGLQTVCIFNVTVNDTELPVASCEDITIPLDANGEATILADDVFVSAIDNCQVDHSSLQVDQTNFACDQVGTNTVTVSIDDIYGNTGTCTATVTIQDNIAPIAICQDITVQLDANGNGSINTNDIDNGSNDACGLSSLSLDITDFACANVGIDNTVTLTVLDNNNNSSSCTAMVTVEDKIEPIALCQDVTVQLDGLGDGSITTAVIDNGSNDACGISSLSLNNNDFTCADVGNSNTVILTVTDNNGNISSCQSTVTVEDQVTPVALCQDVTIQLDATGQATLAASQIDNGSNDACGIDDLSVTPQVFTCEEVGPNTVTLTTIDVNGNQSTCTATVSVEDNMAPIALCQDLTIQLDAGGHANITAQDVDNGSNDACGIALLSLDVTNFTCTDVGTNTVTLTAVDNNDQLSTCTATITVEDDVAPIPVCQDLSIQLDATGSASITATAVDNGSSDACGLTSLTIDITDFGCNDVGTNNIVTLTVTDAHANTSTCTASITIEDQVAPVAICQDLTIQLDDNGTANITPAAVNNGSSDACGIDGLALDKTDFTCTDVGIKTVSLTVSDVNGNNSICTANITVEDNVAPVALCQDVTVQLDDAGNGSLTATEVDMGSSDACGIFQLSLDKTDFSCAEVGSANTVILTVIDNNDNSSTCTATVTVEDNIVPTALCQDVTVQLGPIGNVVLKPSQVDAGSNDACGIVDVVLDITSFDCNDIVTNNVVTLTATDANGNTNTCTATITVEDNQAPVASCMSATVQLDDTGNGSITVTDIDGGSVDNCGISTRELDATDFTCEDIGQLNFVTLTVTDLYGNVATCGAAVIVEDNLDPVADCEDIVVQLDATGQLTITPEEVDGGSNDACGVTPLFVDETTFSCADVGDNTVTLIVTDVNGNENTCTATVTVEDKVLPVANCQNLVVQLDDAGAASISPNQIDNGSSDACGLENISLDITDFSCANVGPNTVTLTVTDVNGNSSNCPAIVTVQDQVSPIALCQDITVLLDATGAISILATDIDNGSNDACGIGSLDLDISTFDCTHIDANTVTLTVTDNNSNVSTCTATVTVMDHVAPVAICQDLTIQLDANGTALVPATAVDNGSNDACGIADYSFLMGATELVTNGGFDTNNTGWTISGVHVTYFNSGGNPGGWLWLNGVGSGGFDPSASQVVSGLTIGQSYLINGSTRNHANCCGAFVGQAALAIDIDGVEQTTVNNPGTIWTDFSYSFTATSTSHTVGFRSEINGHDTDMAIDNISISGAAMSVASKSFDCTQVGPNVLSLQVTDNNGNTSICQATVTIQDKVDPIALCQDVTIQLDANGLASITTTMMDAGSNDACGIAALSLDNTDFSCSDVGVNTVSLTVTDNNDNQSTCTANVTVEDNVAPLALCEDLTIQLDASGVASISTNLIDAGSNDACGIANLVLDDTAFDCTDIGANTVSLTVTDNHGNVATCSAQVTVQDNVMPVALCQDITIQLDASGVATITTTDIDAGSNDACGIANLTLDDTAFDCTDVGENTVTLTVTDNNTNSSTCTAVVTVEDNVAPIALCQNVTLQLDAAGAVSLSTIDVDAGSNDACGIASVTLDNTDFTCADVGTNTVSLTVTDVHTNVSTCTATITVEDQVAPIALCQDVTVQLDAAGEGSITVADVDAGSSDACGFASLNLDATDFSCTDIGVNTVTLTTTDNNGNTTACTATVTVEDHVAPVASCQDVTIQLDANGQVDITTATIDAGSTDACGLASISLDVTDFDCTNIGSNTVTMTVIDNNSNQSSCTATVTVEDKVAPIALCQDVTIQLNAAGAANISATDIDDGSNDACGIANLSLDITAFDCNDVGTNTVSLIVNDNNGNTTNCIATVTVEDNIAPIALCQDITVQLDNLGQAAILPQDLDNGSNDACGLIYQVDVATFDCADIDNLIVVALTVTDPSANSASCIAKVTVEDNIAPLALCQDLTIQLDAQGQASITEVDINANSSDACGIADLNLNLTDFSCADVGANTVMLTVADVNANVSTCSAIVTVEDDIAPVASCKDVTITLDDSGLATLETDDVVVSPPGFANFVDSGQRLSRKRTEGLVLADFDSDGDLDAFTANYKQGNRVWLNNGAAHFNSNGQNLGRYKSCGIDAGDLDGDGDIDAFLGNYGQGNKVWLNNGNALFSPTNQNLSNRRSLGLKLGDLDGDGDLDAFVANDGQGNKVWLNNGRAKFSWRGQHLGYNRSHDVSLGDLDGDGDLDAFVANYGQGNRVWLNNGRGWFSATNQRLGWFESKGVELADLDGDGDLDAFVANEGRPNRIWLNNGSARFTDAGEYLAYNYSTAVALGDIDTDNDLDAFVTNRYQGNKTWLNGGGAAFSHGGQYLARNPSTDVKLGDLDGDGDLDAFVSNYDAANWIWLNNYDAGISDNCGITSIELSDEAFDCFDLGTHEVTVTVTDVHNNSSTCTATVTVLSQSGYDTADINNNGNLDDDCDGVADACDVCPGADDSLDSDNDGIPDCKDYDSFHTIPAEWRCGRNRRHGATKVEICHVPYGNPDNAHTICVSPHAIKSHLDHHGGDYLGPCFQITCGDNIAEEESEDNQDALQSDNQRPAALTDRAIFTDSLATKPVLAIKLFPNPADHESFLDWRNYTGEPATVRIFNQLGQMVKEIEVDEITTPWLHLDLSTYQDGIYNVRVEIADYEPTTHKLVVTKRGRTIKP